MKTERLRDIAVAVLSTSAVVALVAYANHPVPNGTFWPLLSDANGKPSPLYTYNGPKSGGIWQGPPVASDAPPGDFTGSGVHYGPPAPDPKSDSKGFSDGQFVPGAKKPKTGVVSPPKKEDDYDVTNSGYNVNVPSLEDKGYTPWVFGTGVTDGKDLANKVQQVKKPKFGTLSAPNDEQYYDSPIHNGPTK